jgi:hypothetical protein
MPPKLKVFFLSCLEEASNLFQEVWHVTKTYPTVTAFWVIVSLVCLLV